MKRKILSLILVFAMTVSLLTVGTGAVEPTYGDTAGHWAESSIERWSAYGIIQGSNGLFDPNGQLTCAQLATILAKLLKLPAAKDAGFTDNTADAWYYDAINRCAAAGILNGNGDGTVTPEASITRERAMVMLARALGIEPIRKPDLTKYTDAAQVSAYAQGYVAALIEAGIVGGVTADELAPQDNITRAATVTILDRAISTYADKAGATVKADGKGIVLVVAENVKITGAPEGTKIVVADGATGLTVNGKSVSDDQTYIVPKATTSSGSSSSGGHSHSYTSTVTKEPTCTEKGVRTYTCSYDGSTYTEEIPALGHEWGNWKPDGNHLTHTRTCSRGCTETKNCEYTVTTAYDKDTYTCSVCKDSYDVGKDSVVRIGTTGYTTLDDALAADGENNIIVLLKDLDVTAQIYVTKSVTIEGAGHTIKANNASWLTDNSNKHLLNIVASNVTIKNLTLDSSNQAYGNQAYSATGVAFNDVTMVNSNGAGLTVNRSTVTAENLTTSDNAWGGVNVDGGAPHFTLTGNSTLNENNQIWAEKANGPAVVDANGYYCHLTDDGKFYAWSTSVSDTAVAKVKVGEVDVYYTSLEKALSENAGEVEITLVKNATLNSGATGVQQGQTRNIKITGAKDITLSLKNTAPGSEGSLNYQDGANLTFNGITVDASEIKGICARGAAVTFENCVFNTELKQTIADKFVFTGCTFTQPVSQVGYGCKEVLFDNCKFNTNGYGIKIYSEGSTPVNLTVKNSAFKNTGSAAKSAIFLDHIIDGISYSINVEKCTFEGFTSEPTPNENSYATRVIVSDSFVKSGDQYVFSYQTGEEGGSYHKILTADKLTVIIDGKLASKASRTTLQEIINSKPESPVEITLAENETVELKNVDVPKGYILYKKDTDDSSKTYQLMKNEGNVEVSLQELQNLKITKGPKAADAQPTTFTVDLAGQKIEAGNIAYSECNSGYSGNGVLIGGTTMNSYGVKPANEGNYKFVIKGGTIVSAAKGYQEPDGAKGPKNSSVYMLVPSNSDVTFENVTFEGVVSFDIQKYTSPWSNLNSLTFKKCIFNGLIVGTCPASNITFDNCKFLNYTNETSANNSNPIWWRADNEGQDSNATYIKSFTFTNNQVTSTRPVKIERIGRDGCNPVFTFKNNNFDITLQGTENGHAKNMAINIGQSDAQSKFTLIDDGNRISNNTASLYTAALGSGSNQYIAVSGTRVLDGNSNEKVIDVMVWKTTTGETFKMKTIQ